MSDVKKPTVRRPTFQVFDLVGKYIYQMASPIGTVNSVRGLYKRAALSPDITLILGRTESVRKTSRLERIQGDLVFEDHTQERRPEKTTDFLMEFQIRKDRKLGLRVFNYGQAHAQRKAELSQDGGETRQRFPEAVVIYLGPPPYPPERLVVRTVIQGSEIGYEIPVYSVLAHTVEAMEQDKLHLLMPFLLLKHRTEAHSSKTTTERRKELIRKTLEMVVQIEKSLERGCTAGIITESDGALLVEMMETLYNELYEQEGTMMNYAEQLKRNGINLKYPEWKAEKDQWEAEKKTALKQQEANILSLFKQGKSIEEVERLLAQEAVAPGSPQPPTT